MEVGSGYDTLGTIISNISAANRSSMVMSSSELSHVYHLVKPDAEDGDVAGGGTRIMSEVFLTRLLSTKVLGIGWRGVSCVLVALPKCRHVVIFSI